MTAEQYYWFVRRQQLLRAYNLQKQQHNVASGSNGATRSIKPNLKEMWFDDFTEDYSSIHQEQSTSLMRKSSVGACSSVRKGNFHGRNFDFTYDRGTTYVVHVAKTDAHNQFGGIAKATFADEPSLDKLPNNMKDGINDHGVVVNINVVAKDDLVKAGKENTETQKGSGKLKVHQDFLPAYLLAHSTSAVDAVLKMKNDINIYGDLGGLEYVHCMISDIKDTFVVEIIGNEVIAIGYDSNDPADNTAVGAKVRSNELPIMTNWYLNYDELPISALVKDGKYTFNACGLERYGILSANYENPEPMADLMKRARYTNEMLLDVTHPDFPFSDLGAGCIYGLSTYNTSEVFKKFVDSDREKMRMALETENRDLGIWITSHNTVYDIANKTFTFVFEEDYDNPMTFQM